LEHNTAQKKRREGETIGVFIAFGVAVSGTTSPLLLAPPPPFAGVVCAKGCTEK